MFSWAPDKAEKETEAAKTIGNSSIVLIYDLKTILKTEIILKPNEKLIRTTNYKCADQDIISISLH